MKKIYLLSNSFDYSLMICNDAGPNYAINMGWQYDTLENIKAYSEYLNIIDRKVGEEELNRLEEIILKQKETKFMFLVVDPFKERKKQFNFVFFNRIKHLSNVYFLTPYIPTELVKSLSDSVKNEKVLFIPYPFVDRYNTNNLFSNRQEKIVLSGSMSKHLYPYRAKFREYVLKNKWLQDKVEILDHPGYPDLGFEKNHQVVGENYIEYLSKFSLMFISPTRCKLELLKYSECAYARCVPIGRMPSSFSKKMKEPFIEVNLNFPRFSLNRIFSIPIDELIDRSNKYYSAFSQERNPDLLNKKVDNFFEL